MRPKDDIALTLCLFAARMNLGGVFLEHGKDRATDVMRGVLQMMTVQGAVTNWRALSVGPEDVKFEVYIGPALGYMVSFPIASLTPENEPAIAIMCG